MEVFPSIERRLAAIASRQGGHIHQLQLAELGLSAKAIHYRVQRGSLIPVYHRVYAVGHLPTEPHDRAKGALLAAGPRSALSHDSAASYYGIWKRWRLPLHVTVATDRRLEGIAIHRNRRLLRSDIWTPEPGLRVTSPAVTLLDVAAGLPERRLRRAVNEIRLAHRIELQRLQVTAARFPRHLGLQPLLAIIGTGPSQPTRSHWEDEWAAFATKYRLPAYTINEFVAGARVDVLFTEERVIVELDGWDTHQTRAAFVADREQDATILARTGIPTVRVTYGNFHRRPAREAERLHAILARRRGDPPPSASDPRAAPDAAASRSPP